jgi:hypothetical protein
MKKIIFLVSLLCCTVLAACGSNAGSVSKKSTMIPLKALTTKTNKGYPVCRGIKNSIRLTPGKINSQAKVDHYLKNRLFLSLHGSNTDLKEGFEDRDVFGDDLVTEGVLFNSNNRRLYFNHPEQIEEGKKTLSYTYYPNYYNAHDFELKWNKKMHHILMLDKEEEVGNTAMVCNAQVLPDGTIEMYTVGSYNGYDGNNPQSVSLLKLGIHDRYVALNKKAYNFKLVKE